MIPPVVTRIVILVESDGRFHAEIETDAGGWEVKDFLDFDKALAWALMRIKEIRGGGDPPIASVTPDDT